MAVSTAPIMPICVWKSQDNRIEFYLNSVCMFILCSLCIFCLFNLLSPSLFYFIFVFSLSLSLYLFLFTFLYIKAMRDQVEMRHEFRHGICICVVCACAFHPLYISLLSFHLFIFYFGSMFSDQYISHCVFWQGHDSDWANRDLGCGGCHTERGSRSRPPPPLRRGGLCHNPRLSSDCPWGAPENRSPVGM